MSFSRFGFGFVSCLAFCNSLSLSLEHCRQECGCFFCLFVGREPPPFRALMTDGTSSRVSGVCGGTFNQCTRACVGVKPKPKPKPRPNAKNIPMDPWIHLFVHEYVPAGSRTRYSYNVEFAISYGFCTQIHSNLQRVSPYWLVFLYV